MKKKEINEIKRTFKPDYTVIDKVITAFIHPENGIMSLKGETFLNMEDAQLHKYLDVAKSTLGGKLDKNLLNLEMNDDTDASRNLLALRDCRLQDENIVRAFLEGLKDEYGAGTNLCVTLMHGAYDIPVKTSDNNKLDESDEVYNFILCSICPIKMEKAGLYFNPDTNEFETIPQKMIVDKPATGFLYPNFNNRSEDIHEMLYFTKKADEIHSGFVNMLTGKDAPISAPAQKTIFENIITQVAGETSFEEEKTLHDVVSEMIYDRAVDNEELTASKVDLYNILVESFGDRVDNTEFDRAYNAAFAGMEASDMKLDNLIDADSFNIKAPDIQIKVNPDKKELIEKVDIDGGKYFAIPISAGVELNGKSIKG